MHRNCIFSLTLKRDSFFFYCKRRLVQTNVTKLLLTKHNFPLVFYFQTGILFSITASTQITPLVSFYCAGLRRMKQKKSLLKTSTTICFPNFLMFLNSTQNALLCQTCQYEYDALFDGQCSNLWPTTDSCQCIGDSVASIWLAAAISHVRVSVHNIHAWGPTSCYSIWSG